MRSHRFRVSQVGKESRVFTSLTDALYVGDLMKKDNPYDAVLFEQEMHDVFVVCSKIDPLINHRPDIWRGAVFGLYYVVGSGGKTRQARWDEVQAQREAAMLGIDAEPIDLRGRLRETERLYIIETLKSCRWKVSHAAKQLTLPRRTLIDRMTQLHISTPGEILTEDAA